MGMADIMLSDIFLQQLSKFLQAMQQQFNLVRVKELTKGVESIVDVDWKNPECVEFWPTSKELFVNNFDLTVCPHSLYISSILYRLRSFSVPAETDLAAAPSQDGGDVETPYCPPEITTLYSVSARVEPLFLHANKRCVS